MYFKCSLVLFLVGYCSTVPVDDKQQLLFNEDSYYLKTLSYENGFVYVQEYYNNTIYRISTNEKVKFSGAVDACRGVGMKLVTVKSFDKYQLVRDLLEKYTDEGSFWMAAINQRHQWRWYDDRSLITEFYWDRNEPNNAKGYEYCIEIYHNGLWDDQSCYEDIYYVCESY